LDRFGEHHQQQARECKIIFLLKENISYARTLVRCYPHWKRKIVTTLKVVDEEKRQLRRGDERVNSGRDNETWKRNLVFFVALVVG